MSPPAGEASQVPRERPSFAEAVKQYLHDFRVLRETRSEYWGMQLVNLVDSAIYFGLLDIASVFLSEDIGLDDAAAGYSLALYTAAIAVFLFFSGTVTDWLGIRRSTHVAMVGQGILRLAVAVVGLVPSLPHRGWLVTGLLFLLAPFTAMVQTLLQTANKRYTTERSRGAGFSLWYLAMNVGAAAGGFLVDIIRKLFGLPNAHLFTVGAVAALVCSVVTVLMVRNEVQLDLGGGTDAPTPEPSPAEPLPAAGPRRTPFQIALAVVREPAMWRLLVLVIFLLGSRAAFAHLYLLMPKYWLRTIGEGAAIGTLQAINPILIVVGIVLFIPLVGRFRLFSMLVYGAMVSASSLLVLAFPWRWFSADLATAHYLMSILCMVVLSVGEVVWSPKLYEYTAAIAPPGQEGTYLGLSSVPWFLAKTVVSLISGHLLLRWCPDGVGPRMASGQVGYWDGPASMWLLLAMAGLGGCLAALLLRGWLTQGLADERPVATRAG